MTEVTAHVCPACSGTPGVNGRWCDSCNPHPPEDSWGVIAVMLEITLLAILAMPLLLLVDLWEWIGDRR